MTWWIWGNLEAHATWIVKRAKDWHETARGKPADGSCGGERSVGEIRFASIGKSMECQSTVKLIEGIYDCLGKLFIGCSPVNLRYAWMNKNPSQ